MKMNLFRLMHMKEDEEHKGRPVPEDVRDEDGLVLAVVCDQDEPVEADDHEEGRPVLADDLSEMGAELI